jgi:replicative DNA helicase
MTHHIPTDRIPPQATDLEEAILGALMLQKESIIAIADFLKTEHFYRDSHQKIYTAIRFLFDRNSEVDLLTVRMQLQKQGDLEVIGGAYYLTQLTDRVASGAHVEYHSRIVYQKFLQREIIRISSETIIEAYNDTTDIFELHDKNQTQIFHAFSDNFGKDIEQIDDLVAGSVMEMEKPAPEGLTGVGAGYANMDALTGGWQKSDLIIIAARPGMAKTALALNFARNAAVVFKKPTAIFSLEMSSKQLVNRMISNDSDVFLEKINKRTLNDLDISQIVSRTSALSGSQLFIDDTPALTIESFRAKAIRLKKLHKIELIVIDYIQLMRLSAEKKGMNREQEVSRISSGLKSVAKELDIPVIALSQLSRGVESRPDKRPLLSDLRESGSIEQDADQVMFIYRPEYYGLLEDGEGNSLIGLAEIILAKHRNGATDTVNLKFNGALMRFSNWDDVQQSSSAGLIPSVEFEKPNNFILRPSSMSEGDDYTPF